MTDARGTTTSSGSSTDTRFDLSASAAVCSAAELGSRDYSTTLIVEYAIPCGRPFTG